MALSVASRVWQGLAARSLAPCGARLSSTVRIAKRIAESGFCSRREAERLILRGVVSVRGMAPEDVTPAALIEKDAEVRIGDKVIGERMVRRPRPLILPNRRPPPAADRRAPTAGHRADRPLLLHPSSSPRPEPCRPQFARNPAQPRIVVAYNKPAGEVVSQSDAMGRRTVFEALQEAGAPEGLKAVGRLDMNTEGILLLTTCGDLKRRLELPRTGVPRTYRVRVHGNITAEKMRALRTGTVVDGFKYAGMDVEVERNNGRKVSWLRMTCFEGKNRMIRKICQQLHLDVTRLVRHSFGPIKAAKNMHAGSFMAVKVEPLERMLETYEAKIAKRRRESQYRSKAVKSKPRARHQRQRGGAGNVDTSRGYARLR